MCRLRTMGELAGEKHCDCKSCEDDSSNDDSSAIDVGDRREFLWASPRDNITLLQRQSDQRLSFSLNARFYI